MPLNIEETLQHLQKTNSELEQRLKEKEDTIADLRATVTELRTTISDLRATIVNLTETLDELKRKLFGSSSEKTSGTVSEELVDGETAEKTEQEDTSSVKEHTRTRRKKSVRADLYEAGWKKYAE